jgi:hypothetical protein
MVKRWEKFEDINEHRIRAVTCWCGKRLLVREAPVAGICVPGDNTKIIQMVFNLTVPHTCPAAAISVEESVEISTDIEKVDLGTDLAEDIVDGSP